MKTVVNREDGGASEDWAARAASEWVLRPLAQRLVAAGRLIESELDGWIDQPRRRRRQRLQ